MKLLRWSGLPSAHSRGCMHPAATPIQPHQITSKTETGLSMRQFRFTNSLVIRASLCCRLVWNLLAQCWATLVRQTNSSTLPLQTGKRASQHTFTTPRHCDLVIQEHQRCQMAHIARKAKNVHGCPSRSAISRNKELNEIPLASVRRTSAHRGRFRILPSRCARETTDQQGTTASYKHEHQQVLLRTLSNGCVFSEGCT